MHFASIVSLLAIASGVIAQDCASCHIQTDGQSSLTFEDGCALPQGGAKCHYSVHDGSPVKDIYCQYYLPGLRLFTSIVAVFGLVLTDNTFLPSEKRPATGTDVLTMVTHWCSLSLVLRCVTVVVWLWIHDILSYHHHVNIVPLLKSACLEWQCTKPPTHDSRQDKDQFGMHREGSKGGTPVVPSLRKLSSGGLITTLTVALPGLSEDHWLA
ncbi:hypothetical protein V8B97DRAFT_2111388 [Scleroderma yunnanense]